MEKKIETVWIRKTSSNKRGKPVYTNFSEIQAYIYTPEEHAAVQGYREALESILDECTSTDISITHIVSVIKKALSKAEDKGEVVDELSITALLSKYQHQKPKKFCNYMERQYPVSAVIEIIRELKGQSSPLPPKP